MPSKIWTIFRESDFTIIGITWNCVQNYKHLFIFIASTTKLVDSRIIIPLATTIDLEKYFIQKFVELGPRLPLEAPSVLPLN